MVLKKISYILMLFAVALPAMDRPRIKSTRPAVVSDPYSIFKAAERGNLKMIQNMIANRIDINQRDNLGNTPLIIAAVNGRTDVMNALIRAGAQKDIKNDADESAIFAAINAGQVDSVRTLLKAGVNPNQRELYGLGGGRTLLMIATQNKNAEIVKLLVEAGADLDARAPHVVPGQDRTARQMAETASEEVKAYTQLKKEKLP